MKAIEVKGSIRENVGKNTAKQLREEELIPCVMYGKGDNVHFHTHKNSFKELVYTPNAYLVDIDLDGKKHKAVLRDVQFHPVSDKILHADFYEIEEKSPVWMRIPVRLEGSAVGVLNGGRLVQKMRKLRVKALPGNLPDEIVIDISPLGIGNSVKVKELPYKDVDFLEPENAVVVLVKSARGATLPEEIEALEAEEAEGEEGVAEGETPAEDAAESKE
ncbi:MAG: 50S ribosomal protein L25/general stress protein Ctc [Bacteroidales bacterium]|jgi:large subunit ribosomal protein L25|nr:50S ribosomal protein L25/general stress protein Ctc [Bacteroidales bacterium]